MSQANVPDYKVVFLRQVKSAHSVQSSTRDFYLLYWEPMRAYFQKSEVSA